MFTFTEALDQPESRVGREAMALGRHALRLGKGFVLDSSFEDTFYRSNNLPERLRLLFKNINPKRIDEDRLESCCEEAQGIILQSYLLDNTVQKIILAVQNAGLLGHSCHLRREWNSIFPLIEPFIPTRLGSEPLFALKRLWTRDWEFCTTLDRLEKTGSIGLEARPVLFFRGDKPKTSEVWLSELGISKALEHEGCLVGIWVDS